MKPISLTLENFRSYRSHEPMEFGDSALVALIGPTGAGKSSILEAMVYALYGERTDSRQKQDELIAFNEKGMSVSFTFSVEGQVYQVYRTRRNGQALQRLTMPGGTSYAVMSEVDAQIEAVLGLSKEAFLKTVLLPQGRFAELLLDTGPGRSKILAEVLGLTYFEALNANAKAERERVGTIRLVAESARNVLPAKPAADVAELHVQLDAARRLLDERKVLKESCERLDATLRKLEGDCRDVDVALAKFATVARFEPSLAAVRLRVSELGPGVFAAGDAFKKATAKRDKCVKVVEVRKKAANDVATLGSVREQLARIDHLRSEQLSDRRRLDDELQGLERQTASAAIAVARATEASGRLLPVVAEQADAEKRLSGEQAVERAFKELTANRVRLSTASDEESLLLIRFNTAVSEAEEAATAAITAQAQAKTKLDKAKSGVAAAHESHAAAFLGAELRPGDPCPVCETPIRKGFVPRHDENTTAAQAELTKAEKAEKAATAQANAIDARVQSARDAHEQQRDRLSKAQAALKGLDDQISTLCAGVTFVQHQENVMRQVASAQMAVDVARSSVAQIQAESAACEQAVVGERNRLVEIETSVTTARLALAKRDAAIASAAKRLPERWMPADGVAISTTLEALDAERVVAKEAEDALQTAERERATALETKNRADSEFEKHVNRPLQSLRDQAAVFARELNRAEPAVDLIAAATYFDELLKAIGVESRRLADRRANLVTARDATTLEKSTLLEKAGGEILGLFATAAADVARLEERLFVLSAQAVQAAALDAKVARANPLFSALDTIVNTTGANRFPEHLTNQYVTRLLTIASDFLLEMTDQFRFVPPKPDGKGAEKDLRILNVQAGATMPPSNLSGGEKFLASLALSLAVVDQAALSGAKIDSLFLDEGFGSLDAEFVDKAMTELRARTRKGRSIWVITHLREVARYADRTYVVGRTPMGSIVSLNDGDIDEPVDAAGLLTALT